MRTFERISHRNFPPAIVAGSLVLSLFLSHAALAQAPAAGAKSDVLLATADEVFREMSEITGLPIKGPLKKLVLPREQIRQFLEENLDEEYSPQQIHKEEAQLRAFGLVSKDFDLKKLLLTFYTEQAAGAYDPHRKTMFIADWPSEDIQRLVLAHELTHALQDQNYDLVKFMRASRDSDDASAARQAVMEGHATAAMLQRMVGRVPLSALPSLRPMLEQVINQQFSEFPAFTTAPYFFRLQALFPYIQGMGFMQAALRRGGWEGLEPIFADPPTTTKAIYEPDLYFENQALPQVALPRPPALERTQGLRVLSENSFGQLGYYALLGQFISEAEAKTVAPNWLADRFIVYENESDGGLALIARTRWDGSEQALTFFRAYHMILTKKYPELTTDRRSGPDSFVGTASNGSVILLRRGDECLWAEGIPAPQTRAMLDWLRTS